VTTTTAVPTTRSAEQASLGPGRGLSIAGIYRKDGPGVVDITTSSNGGGSGIFGFGQPRTQGEGAGVVYDKQGDILTDQHVVSGASSITVTFPSGRKASARVVGSDTGADVAVIRVRVPSSVLHPLPLGNSDDVSVGDSVVAIGSPFGLPNTVTAGIVSAIGRTITAPNEFTIANAIQTDAAINPGNSGGPLINAAGQVVGLNDQIETNNQTAGGEGSSSGVGFAVPSNTVKQVANTIIAGKQVQHAYIGVCLNGDNMSAATIATTPTQSCPNPVSPGSPAARSGIQPGDTVTAINGTPIATTEQFIATIDNYKPGQTVTMAVKHSGQIKQVKVTLAQRPAKTPAGG
jgi:putative serine protease PepD